jgi:hypothetical protein
MNTSSHCSRTTLTPLIAIACVLAWNSSAVEFEAPIRMMADGKPVEVASPGYAAPAWADIDGDGKMDLLAGQFAGGKIHVFRNMGDGKLAAGTFIQAAGKVAQVPGVW